MHYLFLCLLPTIRLEIVITMMPLLWYTSIFSLPVSVSFMKLEGRLKDENNKRKTKGNSNLELQ